MNTLSEAASWLQGHDNIAILTHVSPDGDALGSALCALKAARALGKRAVVVCQDAVPEYLRVLPGWQEVAAPYPQTALPFEEKAVWALDCADEKRTGTTHALLEKHPDALCIDHHATNPGYGSVCVVEPHAASTGEILVSLIGELGLSLTREMAVCLYVSIATDTGNFSFGSTTARTFACAAKCMEAGVPIAELSEHLFRSRSQARTRLTGRALDNIRYENGVAILRLTKKDFAECGATLADTENLVNYGIETQGIRLAMMAIERDAGTRFSLRGKGEVDVSRIAQRFGGGGHPCAAGATVNLPMDEAIEAVLRAATDERED